MLLPRRTFLRLSAAACGTALVARATAAASALPPKESFHLFLLVGQSNMAGRGTVAPADREPPPRVLSYGKDGTWGPAIDPLHFDKPKVVGVGLGRTFGIAVAEASPGVTVGLIPCAVGGTPISTWEPGAYDEATKTHPWDDAMRRARAALPAGTLKGILWHQGEGDANESRAPLYAERLAQLVARFRRELQAPDVPFIAGQLGQFADAPWSEHKKTVDRAHRELPARVARCAFVNSDGLKHRGDKVHFDADACRELGRRYAAAYFKLVRAS